jgi:hypothetical protein
MSSARRTTFRVILFFLILFIVFVTNALLPADRFVVPPGHCCLRRFTSSLGAAPRPMRAHWSALPIAVLKAHWSA